MFEGVYDFIVLVLWGWNDMRFADAPRSARLPPDEERANMGWGGLDNARDCLDPETEREWLDEYGAPPKEDCDRFIAEAGCGMAELWLMPPRVCATRSESQYVLATVEVGSKRWKARDWLGVLLLLRKAKSGGREWVTEGNIWEGTWTDLSWAARTPQARFLRHGILMSRSDERR